MSNKFGLWVIGVILALLLITMGTVNLGCTALSPKEVKLTTVLGPSPGPDGCFVWSTERSTPENPFPGEAGFAVKSGLSCWEINWWGKVHSWVPVIAGPMTQRVHWRVWNTFESHRQGKPCIAEDFVDAIFAPGEEKRMQHSFCTSVLFPQINSDGPICVVEIEPSIIDSKGREVKSVGVIKGVHIGVFFVTQEEYDRMDPDFRDRCVIIIKSEPGERADKIKVVQKDGSSAFIPMRGR